MDQFGRRSERTPTTGQCPRNERPTARRANLRPAKLRNLLTRVNTINRAAVSFTSTAWAVTLTPGNAWRVRISCSS